MTQMNESSEHKQPAESVHVYEGAGIMEREGHVPLWLWIVVVVLLVWGVYYLVAYWNVPVAPT